MDGENAKLSLLNFDGIELQASSFDIEEYVSSKDGSVMFNDINFLKKAFLIGVKIRKDFKESPKKNVFHYDFNGTAIKFTRFGANSRINGTDHTWRRFVAGAAHTMIKTYVDEKGQERLVDYLKAGVPNPLAITEGLTPEDGMMYVLNCAGFELLFSKYPGCISALSMKKTQMSYNEDNGDLLRKYMNTSLGTKKTDNVNFQKYCDENAAEIYFIYSGIKDRVRKENSKKLGADAVKATIEGLLNNYDSYKAPRNTNNHFDEEIKANKSTVPNYANMVKNNKANKRP